MTDTWFLHGSGPRAREDWHQLHAQAGTWTTSWSDHHGFHQERFPTEPPATTHLWAWAKRRWIRVRIDHGRWWAAQLTEHDDVDSPLWPNSSPLHTRPDITEFRNWGEHDREVRQYRGTPGVRGRTDMLQLVPQRRTTAVFIGDTATTDSRTAHGPSPLHR
ncbi:hypothetical protein [Saccharopolyspora sp. 7B]|uniref:hypothetical protein n=1 Tax=Saccharopolyspora sp. 7B TaxID=2877240 RepID=UPI001CD2F13E|nr:hypothetical protein [Saccharopolyspora sp. 7B]MCA1278256.1 hypothetical protein [Saccharopolyspora sp. 7B]